MLFGLPAGCAEFWPLADFDDESETTLPLLQADKPVANTRSVVTSAL